jgi:hypothetical protein
MAIAVCRRRKHFDRAQTQLKKSQAMTLPSIWLSVMQRAVIATGGGHRQWLSSLDLSFVRSPPYNVEISW